MNVVVIVLLTALAAGLAIAALSLVRPRRATAQEAGPLDPEHTERFLVRHTPSRLRPLMRRLDERVIGGAVVVVSFVALLIAAVVVGWIFSTIDTGRGFARWDESAAEWGARNATDASTRVLDAITQLGSTIPLLVILTVVGAVDYARRRNLHVPAYLATVGIGIVLLNNGLKLLVDRQRPDVARLAGFAGSSFPSGHSAASAACWAAIALVLTRHAGRGWRVVGLAAAAFVAVTVATTRVLLGVHWLTDVIAGVIVGWTWFFLVSIAFGGRLVHLGEPAERVARDHNVADPHQLEHS